MEYVDSILASSNSGTPVTLTIHRSSLSSHTPHDKYPGVIRIAAYFEN